MSIRTTLPDVGWAQGHEDGAYAALILERLGTAMWPHSSGPYHVREALALTRQWRKNLPPSSKRPDPFDIEGRSLLRAAAHHVLDADRSGSPDHLRWAEACLRTWLKGATP